MLHHILVPLDGSDLADRALPVAGSIARQTGAQVHLVAVHQPLATSMLSMGMAIEVLNAYGELDRQNREELAAHVGGRMLDLTAHYHVTTHEMLLEGPGTVVDQLAAYAESHEIDLVVMTTHGRGALGRFLMGSVADAVLRTIGRPCLLLRTAPVERPEGAPVDLAAAPPVAFERVLVPLDGTAEAEQAVEAALDLAAPATAELTLLQIVVPLLWFAPAAPFRGYEFDHGFVGEREQEAKAYLERVATGLRSRGLRVRCLTGIDTSPGAAILDLLEHERFDLLAMAARQRHGADRLLLGSVMDKVVRHAHAPVLVARLPATAPAGATEAAATAMHESSSLVRSPCATS
ncbi:MAG TPA: universal stress protein [Gemmatimonadales bacterium]|nr:universal stress protein [Gemmatimonadales bacterium]